MEKNKRIKILGIDPGSRTTGFAILEEENGKYRADICDVIRMDKWTTTMIAFSLFLMKSPN